MKEGSPPAASGLFRWVCFVSAVLFGVALLVLVWDLKRDVTESLQTAQATVNEANQAVKTVNEKLPEIVSEVKKGSETLSGVAEDVDLIKRVAGIHTEQDRGVRSLAMYASEIEQVLTEHAADKGGIVMIEEIFGSDLKRVETVEEFLVGLNKEMVAVVLPLAKSKQEVLYRTCHSSPPRRKPFYIKFGEAEPISLEDFIKQHHPESAELPRHEP